MINSLTGRRTGGELNFQPRRSRRLVGLSVGLNSEQRALRNLLRKLGIIEGDEISNEAIVAYHRLFEVPLEDDMIEAIAELYGWSLGSLSGDQEPELEAVGGSLIEV
jgi:hypothetical protein